MSLVDKAAQFFVLNLDGQLCEELNFPSPTYLCGIGRRMKCDRFQKRVVVGEPYDKYGGSDAGVEGILGFEWLCRVQTIFKSNKSIPWKERK